MSDATIKQLAGVLGMSVDKLLARLAEAGIKISNSERVLTSAEKIKLLDFLRSTQRKTG